MKREVLKTRGACAKRGGAMGAGIHLRTAVEAETILKNGLGKTWDCASKSSVIVHVGNIYELSASRRTVQYDLDAERQSVADNDSEN